MAHATQIAKMAQAFSQKIEDFELVTSGDVCSAIKGMDSEFKDWYGLRSSFKLVRLPMHLQVKYPFPKDYDNHRYYKLAVLYACLKSSCPIYTRTPVIVSILLKIGVPVVWEWHDPVFENYASTCQQFFTDKNLVGVVTTLPQLAQNYFKHGLAPRKLLIAPNAVDLGNFLPYQEKQLARQQLNLPQEVKIVVYSGHLYEYKGIPTILEAARLLPEYTFVLVGGWEEDVNRVQEECKQNNLHNVRLIGHVPQSQLASYLYAADVLVLPTSKFWNLAEAHCPLKLFDYMSVKRPIVASALPTIMTVLRDRQNALLAQPDEPCSFAKAIVALFDNSSLASAIAEQAYQDVQALTWDTRAERVLQFVDQRLEEVDENATHYRKNLIKYAARKMFLPASLSPTKV
ncbi:glycosyltransferase [Pleurocapsales cyanobacterium LEGE 10410]|nr:glycosyltransferase [Pleurocapsales cyanobacterium LEGE 10410]